jgi:hypothetical protein
MTIVDPDPERGVTDDHDDDAHAAKFVRGMKLSVAIGVALWAALCGIAYAVWRWVG